MDLSHSVKKRINKSAALRAKVLAGLQIDGSGGPLGFKFVVPARCIYIYNKGFMREVYMTWCGKIGI